MIAVNFNTLPYLQVMVHGVRRYSPADTKILIVDNSSTDRSLEWIRAQSGLELIRLPVNVNHGPAMDIGIYKCRTSHFIALDIDAFPISNTWISEMLEPLKSGSRVAGAAIPWGHIQPYVHACCLAMETARFVERHHTFCIGPDWDTAQRISQREFPAIHTIPPTSSRGPAAVGTVFGGVVYHNFYSARFAATDRDEIDEGDPGEDMVVRRNDAESAWGEAVALYFPDMA